MPVPVRVGGWAEGGREEGKICFSTKEEGRESLFRSTDRPASRCSARRPRLVLRAREKAMIYGWGQEKAFKSTPQQ